MTDRLTVVFRVTTRCNLACGFCAFDRRRSQPRIAASEACAMQLGAALAAHRAHTGQPVLLSFLGGEPSLWAPLPRVAEQLRALHALPLSITTNGSRLSRPSLQALLLACFAEVTVSMDALGPAHDALRGWPGGADVLARGIEALAAGKQRAGTGPLLRANVVLMRQTVGELRALCQALARWGIEELTFNALGGRDRPEFYPDHALTPQQIASLAVELPLLRAELAAVGVQLRGGTDYLARMLATAEHRRLPVLDCAPGSRFVFVDEHGQAAPCSFTAGDAGYGLPLPATIAELGRGLAAARAARRLPACDDCQSTQVFGKYGST